LLEKPNAESPAQAEPYNVYVKNPEEYERRVREQALKNKPE
jgi:ubiquitin-conjugating enzyme E2 I